jgi:hypothetical protein
LIKKQKIMPVIIDEVVITVDARSAEAPAGNNAGAAPLPAREELVRECVEKVMEILKQKNER